MFNGLSNDSKLMYRLCTGLVDGDLSDVAHLKIGKVSSARWITFGARFVLHLFHFPNINIKNTHFLFLIIQFSLKLEFASFRLFKGGEQAFF